MNVYEKLLKVQVELKAPKNQFNRFGKYNYRSCEDIQEAVKPLLSLVKAALTVGDEIVQIGDRYYIKATARFIDCESNDVVENTAFAREEQEKKGMDSSQLTGSTSSYARKYALNGLFCIDDVKDSDTTNVGDSRKTNQGKPVSQMSDAEMQATQEKIASQKISTVKINTIKKELERTGVNEKAICDRYKVNSLSEITEGTYPKVVQALKKTKSREEAIA